MQEAVALVAMALVAFATFCPHHSAAVGSSTPGNKLHDDYYDGLCTAADTEKFQKITDDIVKTFVLADQSLAPGLMRLAFHDCIVNGCEAGIMLDSTPGNVAEKDAIPNTNINGFEVIDAVKAKLEEFCPGVFSCSDILQEAALAALRHFNQPVSGVSEWKPRYGRRDSRVSLVNDANTQIPSPFSSYSQLKANFANKGLNEFDLMALSGAHTFGVANCLIVNARIYNFRGTGAADPTLDPAFVADLKTKCLPTSTGADKVKLDQVTPDNFDNQYYKNVKNNTVLFVSDSELKNDPNRLNQNANSNFRFVQINFKISMKRLSEVAPLLFPNGEIRTNCHFRN